ncbi:hydroxylamine oxidoreductase [candidate division KSB1 bacterium]|nr:hydroxylamine oxidoreductase [candidate division KSB1 bacterium]NIR72295.1 hydroxylamine oxidoreductase [candidate division KSB1 bacterium]NIS26687.1 hydroxylamine oxidoreductase [candidate division KSB1 bacterium]NIT70323.1 hydroxylamine oxidoreductase [candidate division KSB1 bacterium]NIU27302.1 hydroxylamine oxidoreductase [candidate division KSB1 bacterium]
MLSLETKRIIIAALSFFLLAALLIVGYIEGKKQIPGTEPAIVISDENKKCVECHSQQSNARTAVQQWKDSQHAIKGVGCLECHQAESGDIDAFEHYTHTIATIVSPKDCSRCHKKEFAEFQRSHHAQGGKILGSLDNVLAEIVEGHPDMFGNAVAVSGCKQCHGSVVEFIRDEEGNVKKDRNGIVMIDPETWPNTGIGRVNPDGSLGSCAACHNRHYFSVAQAREPDDCGKCHLGPDHPQYEIYRESKHGINFIAHKDEMNLEVRPWIVGEDYIAAPTCASCHMSATPNQGVTHDVGERISWTLRPPVSEKIDAKDIEAGRETIPWQKRRQNMQDVCFQCHSKQYVQNFYQQYDDVVHMYNEKFGKPSTAIMKKLKAVKMVTDDTEFDDKIEWTYFYLWHHEGRRARMGAAMMGPDFTQWHGMYEVADRFYTEFVPEVRELIDEAKAHGRTTAAREVESMLNETLNSELHKWYLGKMSPEEKAARQKALEEFKDRYAGEGE